MRQHCTMVNVWLTWLAVPALALLVASSAGWMAAVAVLATAVVAELLYLRFFPAISGALGYGSVMDEEPAAADRAPLESRVVLYTANVCPFCPLVRRRLRALQKEHGFTLEEVDVTFRPGLVREKRLRSVPVVEAGARLLHGNATSAQLASFLRRDRGQE